VVYLVIMMMMASTITVSVVFGITDNMVPRKNDSQVYGDGNVFASHLWIKPLETFDLTSCGNSSRFCEGNY